MQLEKMMTLLNQHQSTEQAHFFHPYWMLQFELVENGILNSQKSIFMILFLSGRRTDFQRYKVLSIYSEPNKVHVFQTLTALLGNVAFPYVPDEETVAQRAQLTCTPSSRSQGRFAYWSVGCNSQHNTPPRLVSSLSQQELQGTEALSLPLGVKESKFPKAQSGFCFQKNHHGHLPRSELAQPGLPCLSWHCLDKARD